MVVHTFNPATWEGEEGGLYSKFQLSETLSQKRQKKKSSFD